MKFKKGDRVKILPIDGVCRLSKVTECHMFSTKECCVGKTGIIIDEPYNNYCRVHIDNFDYGMSCGYTLDSLELYNNKELI
jgi:hypothetical protein